MSGKVETTKEKKATLKRRYKEWDIKVENHQGEYRDKTIASAESVGSEILITIVLRGRKPFLELANELKKILDKI